MTVVRRARPDELVDGPFLDGTPNDPLGTLAQRFARNLRDALDGRSVRSFERDAQLSNAIVTRILAGRVWPDAVTIARLEIATGRSLWPRYEPPL